MQSLDCVELQPCCSPCRERTVFIYEHPSIYVYTRWRTGIGISLHKIVIYVLKNKYTNFLREEEENNLPQMKPLFFLYVWLNLTHIAELQPVPYLIRDKENLVKHIRKRTIQTGRLFFRLPLA